MELVRLGLGSGHGAVPQAMALLPESPVLGCSPHLPSRTRSRVPG